jgi:hypothetical protein
MFRIEMLPAAHGDCLWIEYGTSADVHRILIDGGPAHAYPDLRSRIALLPRAQRCFDLLVISHIDADHIEGVVRLLCDAEALGCTFDRIWFNGREQLDAVPDPAGEPLGSVQGEIVGVLIHAYEDRTGTRVWNQGFDGAIAVDRHSDTLPTVTLPGNCRLAVLSPGQAELLDLKYHWVRELDKAHVSSGDEAALLSRLASDRRLRPLGDVLGGPDADAERDEAADAVEADLPDALGGDSGEPGGDAPFGSDTSRTNASSIALLLEYPAVAPTVRFLLAADAWPSVVERSLVQGGAPWQRGERDQFPAGQARLHPLPLLDQRRGLRPSPRALRGPGPGLPPRPGQAPAALQLQHHDHHGVVRPSARSRLSSFSPSGHLAGLLITFGRDRRRWSRARCTPRRRTRTGCPGRQRRQQ